MNILDVLRAQYGANPAAMGAAITGYGAENTPFPMPPPRPAQGALDPAGTPMELPSSGKGNVLAVIDPALKKKQDEEKSLLQTAMGDLTGGGLTADGKGRSKWGAFANGLAHAMNNQGAQRTAREKAVLEKFYKDEELGLKKRTADREDTYWKRRMDHDDRVQTWRETPDAPGSVGGDGGLANWRQQMLWEKERQRRFQGLGLTRDLSSTRRAEAQRQFDEWNAAPERPWNRAAAAAPAPAPAGATGATPAPNATPAPTPAPSATPATPPPPAATAPAPAPTQAPAARPRARNPSTGAVIEWNGSAWVPAQ
jgi:hypothetical protein